MAASTGHAGFRRPLVAALVAIAAAFVILGVSVALFLTPVWIHGEQARAGASINGWTPDAVTTATDGIVRDLVLGGDFRVLVAPNTVGPSSFDQRIAVLNDREIAHMRNVRGVFERLAILVLASAAGLVVAFGRSRSGARQAFWRAVGLGARGLAFAMAVIGILAIVAFEVAFEVFHELLFPPGSFSFDPATERLVQLFPDQFWSDTALALGLVAMALSIGVAWLAGRRAARAGSVAAVSASASTLAPHGAP